MMVKWKYSADHGLIANPKLTTNNAKPISMLKKLFLVKLNSEFNLMDGVVANDIEDGKLNFKGSSEKVMDSLCNKSGKYNVVYSVTDNDWKYCNKNKNSYSL